MTRVVAGLFRGRRLATPPAKARGVRPTTDRAKTVLFDILGPLDEVTHAVDLYAGTGSLGIEALSRGAARAGFVERDARNAALIRENLERVGASDRSRVLTRKVAQVVERPDPLPDRWPLVLADPPYAPGVAGELLTLLDRAGRVEPGGRVVIEHDSEDTPPDVVGGLHLARRRVMGGTTWSIYRAGDPTGDPEPARGGEAG